MFFLLGLTEILQNDMIFPDEGVANALIVRGKSTY